MSLQTYQSQTSFKKQKEELNDSLEFQRTKKYITQKGSKLTKNQIQWFIKEIDKKQQDPEYYSDDF
jgi:hypothetical protein